ncbi:MAG: phosphatase PAP2 family protein [Ruminococcaceae bacterium]|nr:phosphatase PAP2 family protein [Oscillospiraceae bacterium]
MKKFCISFSFLLIFVALTLGVIFIDVSAIGPNGSSVGFATLNGFFHSITGVNMPLYVVTDWLGLVSVFIGFGFALLGLVQWIKRRNILKVDFDILMLGIFYIVVIAAYLLFESFVINYRPVLINGFLETSYPSSTTLLVLTVNITTVLQFKKRIKNIILRKSINISLTCFTLFMVIGRLISGVHWLSDIIGGVLLSAGLITLYSAAINIKRKS